MKHWVEEAAELVDGEDIQRAYVDVRRSGGFHDEAFDDEEQMSARLRRRVAEEAIAPLMKAVRGYRFPGCGRDLSGAVREPDVVHGLRARRQAADRLGMDVAAGGRDDGPQNH